MHHLYEMLDANRSQLDNLTLFLNRAVLGYLDVFVHIYDIPDSVVDENFTKHAIFIFTIMNHLSTLHQVQQQTFNIGLSMPVTSRRSTMYENYYVRKISAADCQQNY